MRPSVTIITPGQLDENVTVVHRHSYQTTGFSHDRIQSGSIDQAVVVGIAASGGVLALIRNSLLCLYAVIIVFGNVLTLWAVVSVDRLRVKTYALLTSRAVADLAVGVLSAVFVCHEMASQTTCGLATFKSAVRPIEKLVLYASFIHVSAIAVDKFVAVDYPLHYETLMSSSTIKIVIVIVWLAAAAVSLPPYFGLLAVVKPLSCIETLWPIFETVVELVIYLTNSLAVGFVYLRMWSTAIRHETRDQQHQHHQHQQQQRAPRVPSRSADAAVAAVTGQRNSAAGTVNCITARDEVIGITWWQSQNIIRKHRSTKTVLVLLTLYIVLWFPYFLSRLLGVIVGPRVSVQTFQTAASAIGTFNLAVNVFVYGVMNRDFRRAYKRILRIESNTVNPQDR
jgi:hypothetical protein